MGEVREQEMNKIELEIQGLYLDGGFENKRIEGLWSRWEKLNAEELAERASK